MKNLKILKQEDLKVNDIVYFPIKKQTSTTLKFDFTDKNNTFADLRKEEVIEETILEATLMSLGTLCIYRANDGTRIRLTPKQFDKIQNNLIEAGKIPICKEEDYIFWKAKLPLKLEDIKIGKTYIQQIIFKENIITLKCIDIKEAEIQFQNTKTKEKIIINPLTFNYDQHFAINSLSIPLIEEKDLDLWKQITHNNKVQKLKQLYGYNQKEFYASAKQHSLNITAGFTEEETCYGFAEYLMKDEMEETINKEDIDAWESYFISINPRLYSNLIIEVISENERNS